jgi:hypothetical protein
MSAILLTCTVALLLSAGAYFIFEYVNYKKRSKTMCLSWLVLLLQIVQPR